MPYNPVSFQSLETGFSEHHDFDFFKKMRPQMLINQVSNNTFILK